MTMNGKFGVGVPPISSVQAAAVKASDQAVTSTSPIALTSMVITLPASVGDIFLLGMSYAWQSSAAIDSAMNIWTMVGGSPVNPTGPGSLTPVGHYCAPSNPEVLSMCHPYTVVVGDLSTTAPTSGIPKGLTVTFQAYGHIGSAGTRTFLGSSSPTVNIWAIPLGKKQAIGGMGVQAEQRPRLGL